MVNTFKESIANQRISELYSLGYRANADGTVSSPISSRKVRGYIGSRGYWKMTVPKCFDLSGQVLLHRFLGYCKYGDAIFTPGLVVRHLDDNKSNNHLDNLVLGTQKENIQDIGFERLSIRSKKIWEAKDHINRLRVCSSAARKYVDKVPEIFALRATGLSQSAISKKLNIPKSTIHRILNRQVYNTRFDDWDLVHAKVEVV